METAIPRQISAKLGSEPWLNVENIAPNIVCLLIFLPRRIGLKKLNNIVYPAQV
jgi:hypothetical protein